MDFSNLFNLIRLLFVLVSKNFIKPSLNPCLTWKNSLNSLCPSLISNSSLISSEIHLGFPHSTAASTLQVPLYLLASPSH